MKEIEEEKPLASKTANEILRIKFDLVAARSALASGDLGSARARLRTVLQQAQTYYVMGIEFETRLAMAELKKKSGQKAAPGADLTTLEKAARSRGFGLIAGKALSLRSAGDK